MRFVDVVISFPSLFLLITLVTLFQPSIFTLVLIFALFGWTGTARLVRGEFLSLRTREFVLAAKTMGLRSTRIIFHHILPNALGPIIVAATLGIGGVILAERSEEHTSELQSRGHLVCRLLLEKKKSLLRSELSDDENEHGVF